MSAAKSYKVRADLTRFSITDLTSAFVNLRHLHLTANTYDNQPRCKGAAGGLFDDIASNIIASLIEDVVTELKARTPADDADRDQRDFVLVSNALFEFQTIETTLELASEDIGRKVVLS